MNHSRWYGMNVFLIVSIAFCVIVNGDDECSNIIFCDNETHKCIDGHPYNPETRVCKGCGNGIVEDGEECEPSQLHCNSDCTCAEHYTQDKSAGCRPICGDMYVTPEEECDSTMFCHSATCKCTSGHPLNPESHLCSGCGNGVIDEGEDCDKGFGCSPLCTCIEFFVPTIPPSTSCEYYAICGDGIVSPLVEECDKSAFCDNSTCKCLAGHPFNNSTGFCEGCGNFKVDPDEECDGSLNCDNDTCKCLDGFSPGVWIGCMEVPIESPHGLYMPIFFATLACLLTAVVVSVMIISFFRKRILSKRIKTQKDIEMGKVKPTTKQTDKQQPSSMNTLTLKLDISTRVMDFGTLDVGKPNTYSIDIRNPTQRPASIKFDYQKSNSFSLVAFPPVALLKPQEFLNVCVTLTPLVSMPIDTNLDVFVKFTKRGQTRSVRHHIKMVASVNASSLIAFDSITPNDSSLVLTMPRICAKYQSMNVVLTKFSSNKDSYFSDFIADVNRVLAIPHYRFISRAIGGTATPDALFMIYEESFPTTLDVFLSQVVRHHEQFPLAKRISAARDIAKGLRFLHSHQIAHRHLRPSAIFFAGVERDSRVLCKLKDYGALSSSDVDNMEDNTPLYVAPEVFDDCSVTTSDIAQAQKSDMFSFAIVVAELWNCKQPYSELNIADPWTIGASVKNDGIRPKIMDPNTPKELTTLLAHCWRADPSKRSTAEVAAKRLRKIVSIISLTSHSNNSGKVPEPDDSSSKDTTPKGIIESI